MAIRTLRIAVALTLMSGVAGLTRGHEVKQEDNLDAGRQAYEASDYAKAERNLQEAAKANPQNAEIHLLLAKTYYETHQHDAAIASAEKAVSIDPRNSVYHEWLGKVYGDKAEHSGWFSALSLAKKTSHEFERAVELDEKNFSAQQALIEFDCSAPGIAGGGEDKARPHIERLAALDSAEGHYAEANCRRQKKEYTAADVEFTKALESHPQSAALIYDVGDYAMKRSQPERLVAVANEGEKAAPSDPRGKFYRAVAYVLEKKQLDEAEAMLREYLRVAPLRDGYPRPWITHEWLGRIYEAQKKDDAAIKEYEAALKLDPKSKGASEALKRLKRS